MTNCKDCTTNCVYRGKDNESRCRSFVGTVTKADRVRAMSDEELAEFLESTHTNMAIKLGGEYIVRAKEYIGIWLKQPAEGGESKL